MKSKITLLPVRTFNTQEYEGTDQGSHIEFRIVSLINCVTYDIDQMLRREVVQELCEHDDWTVITKKN